MKILLVEDDSALRSALEELLNREGYDVVKTSSIRSAKAEMNSDIDLIMLDVGLPDGDGVSLCRQWRSDAGTTRSEGFHREQGRKLKERKGEICE